MDGLTTSPAFSTFDSRLTHTHSAVFFFQEESLLGQLQEIEARRADVMREVISIAALRAAVLRDCSGSD